MERLTSGGAPDPLLTDGLGHTQVLLGTPTVKIGSIGDSAADLQRLASSVATATGNPTDAKSTATDTTPAFEAGLLNGQIDRLQAIVSALGLRCSRWVRPSRPGTRLS